ncbi:MAG: ABC transporter ATP-binding protein [Bacilli bacterium]
MIKIKNLSVSYSKRKILNDINISFLKEKITTIIGPNGCGKSTLVKAIAGLFESENQKIIIDGKLRTKYKRKEFSKKVAFLMQFTSVPNEITVYDLVTFGRLPHKRKFKALSNVDYEYINWALNKTNTYQFKNKLVSQLSGGEKQRVFLALALAQKTEIIILDEPTNHLDMKYQHEFLELIKKLNTEEKITIVCVIPDVNQAYKYSDNVIVMKQGNIVTHGSPKKCITKETIHNVYDVNCIIEKIGQHHSICIV